MKTVLLIDTWDRGHHISYMRGHIKAWTDYDIHVIFPSIIDEDVHQHTMRFENQYMTFGEYQRLIKKVKEIIASYHPNAIHFLTGDYFLRFFGIGLSKIAQSQATFITFHQFRDSTLKTASLKRLFRLANLGFVHTAYLKEQFNSYAIHNVECLDYPFLDLVSKRDVKEARNALNMDYDSKWIGFIGPSRRDKGLDFLLEAMRFVNQNVHLLIAGQATDVSEDEIRRYSDGNASIKCILRYLSDEEIANCMRAIDALVLPYTSFTGASGPLVSAIAHDKMILCSKGGSLGQLVTDNELGYTFVPDDHPRLLAKVINTMAGESFSRSDKYKDFQKRTTLSNYTQQYRLLCEARLNI